MEANEQSDSDSEVPPYYNKPSPPGIHESLIRTKPKISNGNGLEPATVLEIDDDDDDHEVVGRAHTSLDSIDLKRNESVSQPQFHENDEVDMDELSVEESMAGMIAKEFTFENEHISLHAPATTTNSREFFDPNLITPSTTASTPPPPAASSSQVVSIEHLSKNNNNNKQSSFAATVSSILSIKPVLFLIFIYIVFITGASIYLLTQCVLDDSRPTLDRQQPTNDLSSENDHLDINELREQMTRLENENILLKNENNLLKQRNHVLENKISDLNETNLLYAQLNAQLNATNQEYVELNNQLELQVNEFLFTVSKMNVTVYELKDERTALFAIQDELRERVDRLGNEIDVLENETVALENNITALNHSNFVYSQLNSQLNSMNQEYATHNVQLELQVDEFVQTVHNLNETVNELKNERAALWIIQVELIQEVNHLGNETDRLENTNNVLEEGIASLNETNLLCTQLNLELNTTNQECAKLNDRLELQVDEFVQAVHDLNETVDELKDERATLFVIQNELNHTIGVYQTITTDLRVQVQTMNETNRVLQQAIHSLSNQVIFLSDENERLDRLNEDLGTIIPFLEDAAEGIQRTYDDLANFLSEQIVVFRTVRTGAIQSLYEQRTIGWDCVLDGRFGGDEFGQNTSISIGSENIDSVLNYVDIRLFVQLCINLDDFISFLEMGILSNDDDDELGDLSIEDLDSALHEYSALVMDWYFPDDDEGDIGGLSNEDWEKAGYTCDELPNDKLFKYSTRR